MVRAIRAAASALERVSPSFMPVGMKYQTSSLSIGPIRPAPSLLTCQYITPGPWACRSDRPGARNTTL